MSLQEKYRPVLDLGQEFGVKDGYVEEDAMTGQLKIGGTAVTQFQKDRMWDKIKEIGGEAPADLVADIKVEVTEYYHKHVVQPGESLSKIAKEYLGDYMKYKEMFDANKVVLDNPYLSHPGQELTMPVA